jgi:hypothetical protein
MVQRFCRVKTVNQFPAPFAKYSVSPGPDMIPLLLEYRRGYRATIGDTRETEIYTDHRKIESVR